MDFGKLTKQVQGLVKKRGGMDALKDDAMELKDVATSKEGWADKAEDAYEAVKDPGKPGEEPSAASEPSASSEPSEPSDSAAPPEAAEPPEPFEPEEPSEPSEPDS